MPREGSAGPADTYSVRIATQWARMDGGHPAFDPIPHEHIVSLDWVRTEVTLGLRTAPDQDIELAIPYDVKDQEARYETPDGASYDSPTGFIHHRTERLEGLGDLRLLLNHRPAGLFFEGDHLRVGVGFTVPTGRIEDNPYALAAQSVKHTHIQFGNGTFDPLLHVDYSVQSGPWALTASAGAQLPFYENRKGYLGARQIDFSIGPRAILSDWLSVATRYVALYQTRAYWEGEPDPNSGYFLQGVSLTAGARLSPAASITLTALRPFSIDTRGSGDTFEMDWMFSLGFELSLG